jgi:hypothetical protein
VESAQHHEIKMGSERGFGLVFCCVFLIVAAWPMIDGGPPRIWAGAIAAGFAVVAFVRPQILAPLNRLWFRFGLLLGRIVAPIVVSLVYVLTVIPTGLVMRALGKDLMMKKLDPAATSYWISRTAQPGTMRNQF